MEYAEFHQQQKIVLQRQGQQQSERDYRELAHKVSDSTNAPDAGVVITVEYVPNGGYQYHIWMAHRRGIQATTLWASTTDERRLCAHVNGFIQNTRHLLSN